MDAAPLRVQVKQASAGLKAAQAQLDAVNRGVPSAIDKSAAQAGVNAAQASYDAAHASYKAFLAAYEAASEPVQASMEATLTQLRISNRQAYASLQNAKSGKSKLTRAEKISAARASAQAAVDSASAALALARDTLDDATLVAPIDGAVIFNATGAPGTDGMVPRAAIGTAVTPGTALFTVVDLGSLNFNAQVDEADIDKVKDGMKARVVLDAFSSATFTGTVKSIRKAAIQTTTGGIAFPVLVGVDGAGKNLLIGMSGSADIEVNSVAGALIVPIEAVLSENGKKFVFVVTDNKVAKVEVTTGALTDVSAEVLTGVAAGDVVATSQLTTLQDGMTVRAQ
jgi:HlyD family secretion protein